jgi:hypothetical protein
MSVDLGPHIDGQFAFELRTFAFYDVYVHAFFGWTHSDSQLSWGCICRSVEGTKNEKRRRARAGGQQQSPERIRARMRLPVRLYPPAQHVYLPHSAAYFLIIDG